MRSEGSESGWPGVSVVIPTHARPDELLQAVRSVLAVRYAGPVEIVVVFDGEAARQIPLSIAENFTLRLIENDRARGLAGARNAGILASTMDYVAFLDDDDEWLPDRLEPQISLFREHPRTVLVGGGIEFVNRVGSFVRASPDVITHKMLLRHRITALGSCTYVIRSSALQGPLGLVDESLPWGYGEDWDLAIRAAEIAPVRAVAQPVARVNWITDSYYADTWERNVEALDYLRLKHDFSADPRALARLEGLMAYGLAAAGRKPEARTWARSALSHDKFEKRAILSFLVGDRVVTPQRVSALAARLGRRW